MSWTSNDPSMRATKSTAQYAREQELNERIMAQKRPDEDVMAYIRRRIAEREDEQHDDV